MMLNTWGLRSSDQETPDFRTTKNDMPGTQERDQSAAGTWVFGMNTMLN